jgi:protein farnesyltransferase subunit beta
MIAWLSSRQYSPESGFSGRANKLVDGCYSHWVGGCWSLIAASLGLATTDLWSREGLTRYIQCCAQAFKSGGLRDKPSKRPDAYHSCYNLAGLSSAQNMFKCDDEDPEIEALPLMAPYQWKVLGRAEVPSDEADQIIAVHPVFVVGIESARACREYFEEHTAFMS